MVFPFSYVFLSDEINKKHQKRRYLNKELLNSLGNWSYSAAWMKAQIIKYIVNCYINKQMTKEKTDRTRN